MYSIIWPAGPASAIIVSVFVDTASNRWKDSRINNEV